MSMPCDHVTYCENCYGPACEDCILDCPNCGESFCSGCFMEGHYGLCLDCADQKDADEEMAEEEEEEAE